MLRLSGELPALEKSAMGSLTFSTWSLDSLSSFSSCLILLSLSFTSWMKLSLALRILALWRSCISLYFLRRQRQTSAWEMLLLPGARDVPPVPFRQDEPTRFQWSLSILGFCWCQPNRHRWWEKHPKPPQT